jgi:hypothetical protein
MAGGFFCTDCGKETDAPDLHGMDVKSVTEMCRSWLCNDCLDFAEGVGPYATPQTSTVDGALSGKGK